MKKIIATALLGILISAYKPEPIDNNNVQGDNNFIYGTSNDVIGDSNYQITHNVDVNGSNNKLVGSNYNVKGDNIKMYGVNANIKVDEKINNSPKGIGATNIEIGIDRPIDMKDITEVRGVLPDLGKAYPLLLKRLQ